MDDIVNRLRYQHVQVDHRDNHTLDAKVCKPIMLEAADMIELMREEIEQLTEKLRDADDYRRREFEPWRRK